MSELNAYAFDPEKKAALLLGSSFFQHFDYFLVYWFDFPLVFLRKQVLFY